MAPTEETGHRHLPRSATAGRCSGRWASVRSTDWVVDPSDDPWLRGLHASEPVLHWHGDRIRLPKEASLLGSSLHCPEQLFRIGDHAAGVQCHWEVTAESLKRWIAIVHSQIEQ